jgi:protease I
MRVNMRALIISSDRFEDSELAEPLRQLRAKGVEVDIAAPQKGSITGKHGHKACAGLALDAVRPEIYDLLLLPGGKAPASLRKDPEAVAIARHFLQANKPVAAICHGPQLLIPTGLLAGRSATCYRGMRQELEAAGVKYQDCEVVADGNLITSRRPADIPAFMRAIFGIMGLSR